MFSDGENFLSPNVMLRKKIKLKMIKLIKNEIEDDSKLTRDLRVIFNSTSSLQDINGEPINMITTYCKEMPTLFRFILNG